MTFSGGSGIRTHGGLHHDGFQDRYLQPLGHPSERMQFYHKFPVLYLRSGSTAGAAVAPHAELPDLQGDQETEHSDPEEEQGLQAAELPAQSL